LLTEIGFPALDAADKGAAELSLKITPEALRRNGGSGARCNAGLGARQKAWGANAFRVELDGIDTKSVSSVSAFTVKQELAVDEIGIVREPTKHAAKVTVPNITFKVSRASSADFEAWAEDFLLNGDDKEKSGAIVLLDQSLKGELARVSLNHVGIAGLSPSADGAYFMATVYVESMRFSVGGAKVKEVKSAAVSKVAGESKLAPASAKVVPAAAVEKKAKKT
jgi:hypothetical protein